MTASPAANMFTDQQWQTLQACICKLDARQKLWLSGYLLAQGDSAPAAQDARPHTLELLIAFGGETGNCEKLAHELAALARAKNIAATVKDLATLRARQLKKHSYALLICSTHGDGDPPEPVSAFYHSLMEETAAPLPDLHFAVLALGDSSYEHFCATGRQLDERLAALGAVRLIARQDCDVDFAQAAHLWMATALQSLPQGQPADADSAVSMAGISDTATPAKSKYGKSNALTATVLDNIRLSSEDRSSPIHHLELALDADGFSMEPGDAVGILVKNPETLVASILRITGLSASEPVTVHQRSMPLIQALSEECDLTIPGKNFLGSWSGIRDNLAVMLGSDSNAQKNLLRTHQIIDFITHYPAATDAQSFVDSLRPLQPRLYDVANSLSLIGDELHLTVKKYAYPFRNRDEIGIASDYLVNLQKNSLLKLYPHRNARFHLPESPDVPLILLADGTGIAPYRAFLQEIQAGVRSHPCWLLFSEESFEQDFLYQIEWQQALEQGLLQRLDSVFYRDQPQHTLATCLLVQSALLLHWLADGAHIYLCGDKDRLTACERALEDWLAQHADAESQWQALVKNKRLHRNLY